MIDPERFSPLHCQKSNENGDIPQETHYNKLIVPLLKQFINKLKKLVFSRKIINLTSFDYNLIADSSFFYTETLIFDHKLRFLLRNITDLFPIINPFSSYKMIWDISHLFLILFLFFWIPVEICFSVNLSQSKNLSIILFFLIDILANFNTAYYQNGFLNFQRNTIRAHYLKNYFWSDIFTTAIFLIDFFFHGDSQFSPIGLIKLFFYLRAKTIEKITNKIIEIFKVRHTSLLDLMNLLSFSFFILHVFACLWYFLAVIYQKEISSQTWLYRQPFLMDESDFVKYLYSLYWATVTIMTVGYGDISASNKIEVVFSTVTIFIGCVVFGYIINTIGLIIGDINKEKSIFK